MLPHASGRAQCDAMRCDAKLMPQSDADDCVSYPRMLNPCAYVCAAQYGETALHVAAESHEDADDSVGKVAATNLITALIQKGANIEARDNVRICPAVMWHARCPCGSPHQQGTPDIT